MIQPTPTSSIIQKIMDYVFGLPNDEDREEEDEQQNKDKSNDYNGSDSNN